MANVLHADILKSLYYNKIKKLNKTIDTHPSRPPNAVTLKDDIIKQHVMYSVALLF